MKIIEYKKIVDAVATLCMEGNFNLEQDVLDALKEGYEKETSPSGKDILSQLIKNAEIATGEKVPMCQDCGTAVVFVEMGQNVVIPDGYINDAITDGVIKGYEEGYLRKSMCDPFSRKNTGDNAPAIIHMEIVPGENLKITVAPKGGGAENMSAVAMLPPSAGIEGAKKFILERVKTAGPNPCPPLVIGVGIGGNFEKCAYLAKKALLRTLGEANSNSEVHEIEKDLLESINKLGIGPAGLGGRITALGVAVETMPCHIASFPVAVNINCHAARHKSVIL